MKLIRNGKEYTTTFSLETSTAPVGSIISYAGASAPAGWLMCDGTVYSGLTYPKLYAILPTEWKDLDSMTFSIDLRGRFVEGADGNLGEYKEAGLPNITGKITYIFSNSTSTGEKAFKESNSDTRGTLSGSVKGIFNYSFDASAGETKTDGTLRNDVYGKSDTVQPASLCLNYIIKATNSADNLEEVIDDSKIDTAHTWSSEKVWKMTQTIVLENNIEGIESDTHKFRLNVAGVSAYEDGMTLKVRFRNPLQSSQAISEVSIAINGLEAKPLKVSRSNEFVLMTSHQMTTQLDGVAGFDSAHPHRFADNGICLEMSYDSEADAWIVDGNQLVMSYTSTNKGYTIKADGLIEQWGTKKINKRLSGRTSTGLETFDLYALGYTPSPEGLYEIIVDFYIYDDGDYHGSYFTDVEGTDTYDTSNASTINTHGTTQSRHTSNSCKLLVSRYLYLRIIWASSTTRFNLISIRPVKCPVLMDL